MDSLKEMLRPGPEKDFIAYTLPKGCIIPDRIIHGPTYFFHTFKSGLTGLRDATPYEQLRVDIKDYNIEKNWRIMRKLWILSNTFTEGAPRV